MYESLSSTQDPVAAKGGRVWQCARRPNNYLPSGIDAAVILSVVLTTFSDLQNR